MILAIRWYQHWRGIPTSTKTPLKARVALLENANLNILAEAWDIAARSNASSPGMPLAYYSLDICGINFPGERPWLLRWNIIRHKIDFKGKKFLELGCNLGLLATHAKLSGASTCLGLDIDHDIVQAASLVSRAFDVVVGFRQLNLDDPLQWEDEIGGYDIVSALSVMHWVKNKKRVRSFLGRHKELIYEGHEADIEAEENLRKIGFTQISSIGQSERGRRVFHAIK
jgi:SAM-dependent methyltransferase